MDEKKYWDTYESNKSIAINIFLYVIKRIDTMDLYEDNSITEERLKPDALYLGNVIGGNYIRNIIDTFNLFKNYPSLLSLKHLAKSLINAGYLCEGYGIMQYYGLFSMHALKLQDVQDVKLYQKINSCMFDIDHYIYFLNKSDTKADYQSNAHRHNIDSDILNTDIPYSIYKKECSELFKSSQYHLFLFTNKGIDIANDFIANKIKFQNRLIKIDLGQIMVDTIKLQNDSYSTVFNRGDNYFNNENILDVFLDNDFILQAQVQGRMPYPYKCSAKITDGQITYHTCTCPAHEKYPYTPCKHVIAMCLAHNQYICKKVLI